MAKSKYDPETFPALAEGYAREGMIDKEIAARLGVSEDSFYEYLKQHSEFSEAVKRGKTPVDFAVESALLRLALGGVRTETTRENSLGRLFVSKEVTREVLPDVAAAIFWLRNRRPDKWRGPRGDGSSGEPPAGAGEDAEHPQCPAEGWSPPPATEADAEGGRASPPEQDAPATSIPEQDAPATSIPEQDAPATTSRRRLAISPPRHYG